MAKFNFKELQDAEDRFVLEECFGTGVFAEVHKAKGTADKNKKVAVKIQKFVTDNEPFIDEEYRVLHDFCDHPNLPDFYGAFKKTWNGSPEIWFIMELCEGGPVIDLVNRLLEKNRRMAEEHVGFILKEVVTALIYLHKNHIIHRDIRGSNILMTGEGEIKLVDFGLSRHLSSTFGRTDTCLGSPCWMAPEVVTSTCNEEEDGYGNRADVWALGITAIELGDGKTPFTDMHPTRAMFQIVRNPPPTLYRPGNWSEIYNDFISECLAKNPEYRPFMEELLEHPFFTEIPENNYHLAQELKSLRQNLKDDSHQFDHHEGVVNRNFLKMSIDRKPERLIVEDLAALDHLNEDSILQELESRMKQGNYQTFIGDILLILNPNETQDIYGQKFHKKYICKSRSDNAPHIYAVADSAYQDAIHHITPQYILLAGESHSGKTKNFLRLMDHLLYLGENNNINNDRIKNGIKLIHALTQASTPCNEHSTRCLMKLDVVYAGTGKVSGSIFRVYQLEKLRISSTDLNQANFHAIYYIYDGLSDAQKLDKYHLEPGRNYSYLRIPEIPKPKETRNNVAQNIDAFKSMDTIFKEYEFSNEQIETVHSIVAAILVIGQVKYKKLGNEAAVIENEEDVLKTAELLKVDGRKLCFALTNYCLVSKNTAVRRSHTLEEALRARDVLSNNLYVRMVDYVVNVINHKLSFGRAIFGEQYSVRILDMYGFECFKHNQLQQLLINSLNEQLQYLYLQKIFAWEALEMNEENLPFTRIHYYDNKSMIDEILSKQGGLLTLIDDASKNCYIGQYIVDSIENKEADKIRAVNAKEFSIAHYTGRVNYEAGEMPERNRDFLPPEIIGVLRQSDNPIIKSLFARPLNKTGNVTVSFDEQTVKDKNKFSSSSSDDDKQSAAQYSQTKKMRTTSSTYRAVCLEILKELSVGSGSGGTHFVRCIRSDIEGKSGAFHKEIVRQQIRALAIVETAQARQKGYPHRIIFPEFLRRYKFLAFGFDENVEVTRENCRLLMVRLKMEGWVIGKTKVFLKYYNEEYLARLYETQVRKVVRIQCMMRSFLVRRRMAKRVQKDKEMALTQLRRSSKCEMTQEEAAVVLQKAYRGLTARKEYRPMVSMSEKLDEETRDFIKPYSRKWKSKSLFQVILQYRAAKHHDFFNLSQQVHFFNQKVVHNLHLINRNVDLSCVEPNAKPDVWLDDMRLPVLKLPFRLDQVPYFDTSYMCDHLANTRLPTNEEDSWDFPFRWRDTVSSQITTSLSSHTKEQGKEPAAITNSQKLPNVPYSRSPSESVRKLSSAFGDAPAESRPIGNKIEHQISTADLIQNQDPASPIKKLPENVLTKPQEKPKREDSIISVSKVPRVNPIAELQHLGRRFSGSDDDPPFNFQGMLRKTNFQRESLKRAVDSLRVLSRRQSTVSQSVAVDHLAQNLTQVKVYGGSKRGNLKKHSSVDVLNSRMISTEVAPGIFMEGLVTDL